MKEIAPGVLAWLASQPVPWHVAAVILAGAPILSVLRYLTFLCGLTIAMRRSTPSDRPEILRAYGACWTSARGNPGRRRNKLPDSEVPAN